MALLTKPWTLVMIVLFTWLFDMAIKESIETQVALYPQYAALLRLAYISIPLIAVIVLVIIDKKTNREK